MIIAWFGGSHTGPAGSDQFPPDLFHPPKNRIPGEVTQVQRSSGLGFCIQRPTQSNHKIIHEAGQIPGNGLIDSREPGKWDKVQPVTEMR